MTVEFDWLIHYRCNYRCPYCFFDGMWQEVESRTPAIPVDEWIAAWRRVHDRYGDFRLIITGGEPTIFPGFPALLGGIAPFAHISFDTNLSCPDATLDGILAAVEPRRLFIGMSFHPTHADPAAFLRRAERVRARGVDCRVHYVTYPPHIPRMPEVQRAVQSAGLRFTPIPFRGHYAGKRYPDAFTDDEKARIHAVTGTIAPKDRAWSDRQVEQVRSRDRFCHAGSRYARVDSDGTVYPCGNDFTRSAEKMVLGNVLEPGFALNTAPMRCRQETCPCEFRWIA